MLFADRLEVWNPATLPPSLTLEKLRQPHGSVPHNPLLAEPLYLTRYIKRMGTGTGDMIRRCREAGQREPDFAIHDGFVTTVWRRPASRPELGSQTGQITPPVTPPVLIMLRLLEELGELGNAEIRQQFDLRDRTHLRERYLDPSLHGGWIEMTIPDKPNSHLQKYRLTEEGKTALAASRADNPPI